MIENSTKVKLKGKNQNAVIGNSNTSNDFKISTLLGDVILVQYGTPIRCQEKVLKPMRQYPRAHITHKVGHFKKLPFNACLVVVMQPDQGHDIWEI